MFSKNENRIDLLGLEVKRLRNQAKLTVLYREGGTWTTEEISELSCGLMTCTTSHPKKPEYLVLEGDFSVEVNNIIRDGKPFTLQIITGMDNPKLPFAINF